METPISYRDSWVEIDLDQIAQNVRNMKAYIGDDRKLMAVVKANGYGHGALEVARTALAAGAEWLGVALLDEALALRRGGIKAPILVLGWIRPEYAPLAAECGIAVTAFQLDWVLRAGALCRSEKPLSIHLKLDSGMGRLGTRKETETKTVVREIMAAPALRLEGLFTHFATADETDLDYFQQQYNRFLKMCSWVGEVAGAPSLIHCANSAAGLRFPEKAFDLIRFGISMYGLAPSEEMKPSLPFSLKPAFSLYSRLTHVKQIDRGEGVSYGAEYRAKGKEWIGTVPLGYADGWLRQLARDGSVLVEGERAPIVGKICMDQFMIRLPRKVAIGTKVTLIGRDGDEEISIDDIARQLGTIVYEIPCMIHPRVPRVYFKEQEMTGAENDVLREKIVKKSRNPKNFGEYL